MRPVIVYEVAVTDADTHGPSGSGDSLYDTS